MPIQNARLFFLSVVMFWAGATWAQAPANDDDQRSLVDVVPGFPPFDNVDDPHPADFRDIEANIFVQGDRVNGRKTTVDAPYFDLNYGVAKNVQLKWEGWYVFQHDSAAEPGTSATQNGFGNNLVGVKWMFLDDDESPDKWHGLSAAIYPQVQFAPSPQAVAAGLAEAGRVSAIQ